MLVGYVADGRATRQMRDWCASCAWHERCLEMQEHTTRCDIDSVYSMSCGYRAMGQFPMASMDRSYAFVLDLPKRQSVEIRNCRQSPFNL